MPFLDLKPAAFGFGALADFRDYFDPIEPMVIYPTIAVGFLAGPERVSLKNSAMPLFNPGVGVKVKFGNVYAQLRVRVRWLHHFRRGGERGLRGRLEAEQGAARG